MTRTIDFEKRGSFWSGIFAALRRMPLGMAILFVIVGVILSPLLLLGMGILYIWVRDDDSFYENGSRR